MESKTSNSIDIKLWIMPLLVTLISASICFISLEKYQDNNQIDNKFDYCEYRLNYKNTPEILIGDKTPEQNKLVKEFYSIMDKGCEIDG